MITTVTLNAAIDKTYYVTRFKLGGSHRASQMFAEAGGKGINVARTLFQLGLDPIATGFLGGNNGAFIEKELDRVGIKQDFVHVAEESRICLNIIDETDSSSTEVLESGPAITADELELLRLKVAQQAEQTKWIVFSGSLPKGLPPSTYAELIDLARKKEAHIFLDTSGEALRLSIPAKPFFIKPNEKEIAELTGKVAASVEELCLSIQAIINQGIACVTVSLGEKGSITGYQGKLYRATVPQLQIVNTVGCGDAFVAGMVAGFSRQEPIEACIRLAAATGTANALSQQAGYVRPEDVEHIQTIVRIEEIYAGASKQN
jgi:tagatose 6-phosphate kinase